MDLEDVAVFALSLPETDEGTRWGRRTWRVTGNPFAWERAFTKADLKRFGDDAPPAGPIAAVSTGDLDEKASVLAAGHDGVFDIAHFDGFPAVLIALDDASDATVRELIVDGWLAAAPEELADAHAADLVGGDRQEP